VLCARWAVVYPAPRSIAPTAIGTPRFPVSVSTLAAFLGTLAEIPARLAALERAEAENAAKLEALSAALPPKHVTVSEAAQLLGVSIPTMRRWVRKRVVPTFKVGRVLRVDVSRLRGADAADIGRKATEARGAECTRPTVSACHLVSDK
jgi:excisionase family DNA binding protein